MGACATRPSVVVEAPASKSVGNSSNATSTAPTRLSATARLGTGSARKLEIDSIINSPATDLRPPGDRNLAKDDSFSVRSQKIANVAMSKKHSLLGFFVNEFQETDRRLDEEYDLTESVVLGHGMSGSVSTIRHRATGEIRALKSLTVDKVANTKVSDLQKEIKAMKRLDHPNIVRLLEVYEEVSPHCLHLVMELCNGGELVDRVQQTHGFDDAAAATIMSKLLGAILHCHQHGVIHRDIKLDNFVYESPSVDAEIKLIDFGLSHVLRPGKERMREKVGTLSYMAPEVLLRQNYTAACDMWSLGVVAYMLLSGQRPFHHPQRDQKIKLILESPLEFRGSSWQRVRSAAKDFIGQLLKKDPRQRMSARQALDHPWIQEARRVSTPHEPGKALSANANVLRSVQAFAQMESLKKVALEVVAFTTPTAKLERMRKLFTAIDQDSSGTISREEFQRAMSEHPELQPTEVDRLFSNLDLSHKGSIDYNEFIAATLATEQNLDEASLRAAFTMLDFDSDGAITKADLMQTVGKACSEAEIEEMLTQLNCEGKLFFPDLVRLMEHESKGPRIPQCGRRSLSLGQIALQMEQSGGLERKIDLSIHRERTEPNGLTMPIIEDDELEEMSTGRGRKKRGSFRF